MSNATQQDASENLAQEIAELRDYQHELDLLGQDSVPLEHHRADPMELLLFPVR